MSAKKVYIQKFNYESATAQLNFYDDGLVTLSHVYSKKRGLGHATGVVRLVTEFADEKGIDLTLQVRRYGHTDMLSPSNEQLIEFYSKFGFNRLRDRNKKIMMTRKI